MTSSSDSKTRPAPKFHAYPMWSPRFWHGMRFGDWMQLLWENRFQVSASRLPMALLLCLITPFNSVMRWAQRWRYGRQVDATAILQPPVFIIGHWRSGTTLLHELMAMDDRFTWSNTFQCFAPHHFLLTEWFFVRYCKFLLPKRRPMDDMTAGWQHPQEDEFALLTMGVGTPYRRMAFPNRPPAGMNYLDMEGLTPDELARWRRAMEQFVRLLTFREGKQVLLKSPPHTGRIGVLADLFPGARFIHIARDPYAIFASTRRLWQALDGVQGCQVPRHEHLDQYVFDCLDRMYEGFRRQQQRLGPGQLVLVRYEDLVEDPVGQIQRLYEELGLDNYESLRPKLEEQARKRANYRVNRHELDPETRALIRQKWAAYFEQFGYE